MITFTSKGVALHEVKSMNFNFQDSKSSGRKEPRLDPILPLVAISDDESGAENLLDNGVKRKQAKEASEPNADVRISTSVSFFPIFSSE